MVLLGPILVDDVAVERRLARVGGDLARGQDHLAVLLHLGEHRIPDPRRLDVAALPRRAHFRRAHVEDLHVLRVDARLLEGDDRVEVGRRVERHRDLLALQVLDAVDARAVLHDERLGVADVVEDPEQLVRLAARHRRGDPGRPHLTDLDAARRHRLDHLAAAAELLPVDLVAGGFFEILRFLRDAIGIQHVLVGDRHFLLLRERGARRECEHEPDARKRFHEAVSLGWWGTKPIARRPSCARCRRSRRHAIYRRSAAGRSARNRRWS